MAISNTELAASFVGNNSTSTPYTMEFPFFDAAHIFVAVRAEGEEEPALLEASGYTVTMPEDGQPGWLVTAVAYPPSTEVIIFRQLPFVQPAVFPPAGPFPAKANEAALDRAVMLLQQLNRRVNQLEGVDDGDYVRVPGGGTSVKGLCIWTDATARANTAPEYLGQVGVQTADWSLWVAHGLGANLWVPWGEQEKEWRVFDPGVEVPSVEARFVGTLSRGMLVSRVAFAVAEPAGVALEFTLFAGAYEIGTATLAADDTLVSVASEIDEPIPAGTPLTMAIEVPPSGYVDPARGLDVMIQGRGL